MRNRAMLEGRWNPEGDTYLTDFRIALAVSLAYQKRYAEAFPLAEQWERVHLKLKEPDAPFIQNSVKICLHNKGMHVVEIARSFEAFIDSLAINPDMI